MSEVEKSLTLDEILSHARHALKAAEQRLVALTGERIGIEGKLATCREEIKALQKLIPHEPGGTRGLGERTGVLNYLKAVPIGGETTYTMAVAAVMQVEPDYQPDAVKNALRTEFKRADQWDRVARGRYRKLDVRE
jgi:hypothetical protein